MPLDNSKLKTLYSALKKSGYSKDYNTFATGFGGTQNYANRKSVYDYLKSHGANIGDTYEEFMSRMYHKPTAAEVQNRKNTTERKFNSVVGIGNTTNKENLRHIVTSGNKMLQDVDVSKSNYVEKPSYKKPKNRRVSTFTTIENGVPRNVYVTDSGTSYEEASQADKEQNEIYDVYAEKEREMAQSLKEAYKEKQDLNKRLLARQNAIDSEQRASMAGVPSSASFFTESRYDRDPEAARLQEAINQTDKRITALENAKKLGKEHPWQAFFKGAWDGVTDADNWSVLSGASLLRSITAHSKNGGNKGKDDLIKAEARNNEAQQYAQEKLSNSYNWGNIAGTSIPFVADFMVTNVSGIDRGIMAGTNAMARKTIVKAGLGDVKRMGVKGIAKSFANKEFKDVGKSLAATTIRDLGITSGELATSFGMTTTIQSGKTLKDIGKRNRGEAVYNPTTNKYEYVGGKSLGRSIFEGVASSTIENYTEMLGEHLPLTRLANQAFHGTLNKLGLSGVSSFFTNLSNKNFIKGANAFMKQGGMQGYANEVAEEEIAIPLHAIFDGDNQWSDLLDKKQQTDIWAGMLFSIALSGSGAMALHGTKLGVQSALYYKDKHQLNKLGEVASFRLTDSVWQPIKQRLDNATNNNLSEEISNVLSSKSLGSEEKKAVADYAQKLISMRGHNMASMKLVGQDPTSKAYAKGYTAEEEEKNKIKNNYLSAQEDMRSIFGDTRQSSDKDLLELATRYAESDNEEKKKNGLVILDFLNAKSAYDGMIARAKDDVDDAVEDVKRQVSETTNGNGQIQSGTLKQDNKRVHVVSGDIVTNEDDGSIDVHNSSNTIVVRDEETGKLEMISPNELQSVDAPIDAAPIMAQREQEVREAVAKKYADQIDGTLGFNVGDEYNTIDDNGQSDKVKIVEDKGNSVVVTSSQSGETIELAKDDVQRMSQNFVRHQIGKEKAQEEQNGNVPTLQYDDTITLTDEDGNAYSGTISDVTNDGVMVVSDNGAEMLKPEDIAQRMTSVERNGENIWNKENEEGLPTEEDNTLPTQENEEQSAIETNNDETIPTEASNEENTSQTENINEIQEEDSNQSALARIPKDNDGNPIYEQTDADTAWDAIMEQTEGDEEMAQSVADSMVADKEKALHDVEKEKIAQSGSVAEKIAAAKEHKKAVENAKAELEHWKEIASARERRMQEEQPKEQVEDTQEQAIGDNDVRNEQEDKSATQSEDNAPIVEDEGSNVATQGDNDIVLQNDEGNVGTTRESENESGASASQTEANAAPQTNNTNIPTDGEVKQDGGTTISQTNNASQSANGLAQNEVENNNNDEKSGDTSTDVKEKFNSFVGQLATTEGEERMHVLEQMRDIITQYAEENGYPVPEYWLTTEDYLNHASPKDRAKLEDGLANGYYNPGTYRLADKKVYIYVEGCNDFDRCVRMTLAHEYTHADNDEVQDGIDTIVEAVKRRDVTLDELLDILWDLSKDNFYEEEYDRLEAKGKDNGLKMLADEVIAHIVSRMVVNGKQTLNEITQNPTISRVVTISYNRREDARRFNILQSKTPERGGSVVSRTERDNANQSSTTEGKPQNGRHGRIDNGEESLGSSEANEDGEIAKSTKKPKSGKGKSAKTKKGKEKNSGQLGLVSDERMEELKRRLRSKLNGQLNVGIDPEILAIAAELATGYIDRGLKKFSDFAKTMLDDIGDVARPYIKMSYNAARDYFEDRNIPLYKEMTPYDEVKRFDVANFDKEHTDTIEQAKQVAKEQKVEEEAKQIKKKNISKEDTKQSETQQTDNQGNPLNADGTLKLEKIASVDELTDEDFSAPTRNVELPKLPKNVDDAIGANGKPVIIKKNIFEKNWEAHKFPFAESRSILKSALYNTDLVGQTQPTKRPLHWVAIKLDEKSPIVVLEVNENKDNVEMVGWYTLDGRNLERIKRQAEKNGGEFVMLSSNKVESLSTPQNNLSSKGEDTKKSENEQPNVDTKQIDEAIAKAEKEGNTEGLNKLKAEKAFCEKHIPEKGDKKVGYKKQEDTLNITSIVNGNTQGPCFRGIHYENGFAIATDGHTMVITRQEYPTEYEGKTIGKYGRVIDLTFPKWTSVIPMQNGDEYNRSEFEDVLKDASKRYKKFKGKYKKEHPDAKAIDIAEVMTEYEKHHQILLDKNRGIDAIDTKTLLNILEWSGKDARVFYFKNRFGDYVIIKSKGVYALMLVNKVWDDIQEPDTRLIGKAKPIVEEEKTQPKAEAKDDKKIIQDVINKAKLAMVAKLDKIKNNIDEKLLSAQIKARDRIIDDLDERVKEGELIGPFGGMKNVDLQQTLLKCIGEREALNDALDDLTKSPNVSNASNLIDSPNSWVGRTFVYNGMTLVCKEVSGNYATFDNKSTFMNMGFEVPVVQGYLKSGKFRVKKETNQSNQNKPNEDSNEKLHVRDGESHSSGESGHERGQNEPLGTETGDKNEQSKPRGVGGRGESHTQSDTNGGRGVSAVPNKPSNVKQNTHNNHGERGVDYAPRSVDARIRANLDALELAKRLLYNGEIASEEDMAILRKYSGWGGLGSVFGHRYDMQKYQERLKELLGEEAYKAAFNSTQSAFYTPVGVIDSLWDIATALGIKGGNVLEGSAGIGNILGQMPMEISEHSRIRAVEIDPTSGGILSLLYPDAKVDIQGFEKTKILNNSVNLAITNVPFVSGLLVNDTSGDADLSKMFNDIHDFCIAKNVRKLRQGGIGIFITSSSTLDNSSRLRNWLVNQGDADVIGAFRLNNKTFGGTNATSDIIVVRKRVNGVKSANAIDVSNVVVARTAMYKGEKEKKEKPRALTYNEYFVKHPEMMGGEMRFGFEEGNSYRPTSMGLYESDGIDQAERLKAFVGSFKNMKEETGVPEEEESPEEMAARLNEKLGDGVKEGSLVKNKKGLLCVARGGVAEPIFATPKKGENVSAEELAKRFNEKKIKGHTKAEVYDDYQAIKTALKDVLDYQTEHDDDKGLKPLLKKLNDAYDHFVNTYGHFHNNNQLAWLRRNDVDSANVWSLETYKEKGDKNGNRIKEYGKSDVFTHRVVAVKKEQKPKTIKDGVMVSLYKTNHIDLGYIADALGKSEDEVKQAIIKNGYGYEDPISGNMEVSYVYLSGNVRDKLAAAKANNEDGRYNANIKALEEVVPTEIPAHLIGFNIGSSWCPKSLYEEYLKDRTGVEGKFTYSGGTWLLDITKGKYSEKNSSFGVKSYKYDGVGKSGSDLVLAAMTYKPVVVGKTEEDEYGKEHFIKDKDATLECARRVDEIRQDFKDWAHEKMQTDQELAQKITILYNDKFNSYIPLKITDAFAPTRLDGMTETLDGKTTFELRPHQARAVVKCVTENTLLAHQVGTGKTFTLISTAMQMRKLGTAKKPMIVVQNATTGQFVESAKQLYPNAKILTITDDDKGADGRKNFYAKIRYNDWDMIVVPQSVFERIPDSKERRTKYIQERIDEKLHVLEALQNDRATQREAAKLQKEIDKLKADLAEDDKKGDDLLMEDASSTSSVRGLKDRAKAENNAKVRAERMLERKVDEVEDFDQMGIDALLVDEAHAYKHLGFATAMTRGVKGVDPSFSKRSQSLYLKIQSVKEKNGGKNIVFATGTPVSNTAAEIWTMLRYLCPKEMLESNDIYYFDDFVRNFGRVEQHPEFTPSGAFKESNRFLGYTNVAELARMILSCTDFVLTSDAKGVNDKIPELEGGKAQDIYLPQSRALRAVMKYVRSELERFEKMSGKEKKENSDLVLRMYGIATTAAIDPRLVQANAEDDPHSKTNEAVRQTLRSLKETADYNGTIAIFSDHYQNKQSGFNLYEDIKKKLVAVGVPSDQIAIISSNMSDKKKLDTFDKINRGEVRVVLGSTATLGTGVNIQERLHTLIHLDAPNRPMDYEQRNGRILRQGNLHREWNKSVRVIRMGVEDSLDVTAYQRLKTKQAFVNAIMNSEDYLKNSLESRTLDEEEDDFGDVVANLSGSEYAILREQAARDLRRYESRLKQWEADKRYIEMNKPRLKEAINRGESLIKKNKERIAKIEKYFPNGTFKDIHIGKLSFGSVDEMEEFFKNHNKKVNEASDKAREDGKTTTTWTTTIDIDGLKFEVRTEVSPKLEGHGNSLFTRANRILTYSCKELGIENMPIEKQLLKNGINDIVENVITAQDYKDRLEANEASLVRAKQDLALMEEREGHPFEFADKLAEARVKYDEYEEKMKEELAAKAKKYAEMDKQVEAATDVEYTGTDEEEEESTKSEVKDDELVYREEEDLEQINDEFNRRLDELTENPNQNNRVLSLGRSSDFLKDGGITDAEIKLEYDKIVRKSRVDYRNNHPFEIDDLKNLPLAIANPIAVFDSSNANDHVVLTELQKNGENFIVAIRTTEENRRGGKVLEVNEITSLYPKDEKGIIHWINTGRLTNVDKEKALHFIAALQPHAETTINNEELSNAANVVRNFEILNRDNSKKAVQQSHERISLPTSVQEKVEELHLGDEVKIVADGSGFKGKKRKAKGFYNKQTGKITIILGNHTSVEDVMQTLMHEAVAHKGLRKLFGKDFNAFLDKVYAGAEKLIREKIVALAAKHGWNLRTATEEYLASLAEDEKTFEKHGGFWEKVRIFFHDMAHKLFPNLVKISDNELRYELWRSYENLKRDSSVIAEAKDIAMQSKLKVGEFAEEQGRTFDEEENLYREERQRVEVKHDYDMALEGLAHKMNFAWSDSMSGLKILQDTIAKAGNTKVEDWENAYMAENRMSSINMAEMEAYKKTFYKDLVEAVNALAKGGVKYKDVIRYMYAKHGLERNKYMQDEKIEKLYQAFSDKYGEPPIRRPNDFTSGIDRNDYASDEEYYKACKAAVDVAQNNYDEHVKKLEKQVKKISSSDYSGLSSLFDEKDFTQEARNYVDKFEKGREKAVDNLWDKVNKATHASLEKRYKSGLMSSDTYHKILDMFEYYIPLKGFEAKTSDEVYNYMGADRAYSSRTFVQPMKGRLSVADDPIANIGHDAELSIVQGNRNKMKQHFLYFVLNHPSDLVSVSDLYLKYDPITDEWKSVFCDTIEDGDSAEVVAQKVEAFNERMEALCDQKPDEYKRSKDAKAIPYRVVTNHNLNEHQVYVKVLGKDYVLTINGNPEAAQALNGLTNPEINQAPQAKIIRWLNNGLSQLYTAKNAVFTATNFSRDAIFANTMVWAKESKGYAIKFHINFAKATIMMGRLMYLGSKFKLDDKNEMQRYYKEFVANGGKTGYTFMHTINDYKNEIAKMLVQSHRGYLNPLEWARGLNTLVCLMTEGSENISRFSAYMTSRQMGRSIERSIWDAKEITVNFNKKGAGHRAAGKFEKGNRLNYLQAGLSSTARGGFVFWNAGIQALSNISRTFIKNKAKTLAAFAGYFAMGVILPAMIGGALAAGGGDDDYFNLPEFVRRNNICIKTARGWIVIPLPIELRAFYGLGELAYCAMSGREKYTKEELAIKILQQMTQVLPIDPLEGGGGFNVFIPSVLKPLTEVAFNVDWTGKPIYKEDKYNQGIPEWQKVYKGTSPTLIALAQFTSEHTKRHDYDAAGWADFNPAKVQHILEGYLGGVYKVGSQLLTIFEQVIGDKDVDIRNVPFGSSFFKTADDRTKYSAIQRKYFDYMNEAERNYHTLKEHEEKAKDGDILEEARYYDMLNSEDGARIEIYKEYKNDIKEIRDKMKEENPDTPEYEELNKELMDKYSEVVQMMDATRN